MPRSVFGAIERPLTAGDTYNAVCSIEPGEGERANVVVFLLTDEADSLVSAYYILGGAQGEIFAKASVGGLRVSSTYQRFAPPKEPFEPSDFGVARRSGMTLRIVWAGWNTDVSCHAYVNGDELTQQAEGEFVFRWPTEFQDSAAIDSTVGALALGGSYDRQADGFVISILYAPHGEGRIVRPDGTEESGDFVLAVGREAGVWQYTGDKQATLGNPSYPTLAIMELDQEHENLVDAS